MKKANNKLIATMVIVAFVAGMILGAGIVQVRHNQPDKRPLLHALQPLQKRNYWVLPTSERFYLYDSARFIGSCEHGKDGIDSLILKDNE